MELTHSDPATHNLTDLVVCVLLLLQLPPSGMPEKREGKNLIGYITFSLVHFRSVPSPTGSSGRRDGRFSRDLLPVFFAGGPREQFWHGQGCPLLDVVHSAFPLPTTTSPTLQSALKDGFEEAVVTCDMPEPCQFPSLDSCQKRFLWTHN